MAEQALAEHLAVERSTAAKALLAGPLLDSGRDPESYRLVARHAQWLTGYFEDTCGWVLTVDVAAGYARLAKRAVDVDISRPLRRSRGERAPFDRRRYQLLCLVCAQLIRHPVTTIGLLADAVMLDAGLDTSRHAERGAFVDALRVLVEWGALRVSAGDVDAFIDSESANALLTAETARLHRLLVSATAPSALEGDVETSVATDLLRAEPRYGVIDRNAPDETRNRWARHRLGRRLLDDPAVYLDDLTEVERDYLASLSGRRWLRDRVVEAGFELEERADGLLAIDPDRIATDRDFPAPRGNAHQLALLLVDRLIPITGDGRRDLGRLSPGELERSVADIMRRYPAWARGARDDDGVARLTREAVDLLVGFGLARREPDGSVSARPALARYRVGEPRLSSTPSLYDDPGAEEQL